MHVVAIRHHRIDQAGFVADGFAARGAEVSTHLFPREGPLPALDGVDHVVVLGAAWSVYEERISGWLGAELDWLRAADAAAIPVLGICFGAQALTVALGGQVEAAPRSEIGWVTVSTSDPDVIEPGPWLEFHHDRCLPPPGARVLAHSDLCVQAFSVGPHLAVQFHPEVDGAQVGRWLTDGGRSEAERAGQDPDALLAQTLAEEPAAAARADRLVAAALRLASDN
ncbi:MAG: gamma-glutamyl-gamma-aminobutyrate hydrolase family protein [Actinobacteria bacterium]|nr:gamma-glutamyl-gamma-aminobutyrate hydrolase family protein [Actinomycetota bacterium]MBO0838540.1 gamma-glutamyl-gamma-aminobutyrate hydrolase family protein [Actinomycetota bacterium]